MAYYDPITGEYKEGEDPNAPAPSPTAAIAAAAPDPKAGFVKVGSTGDQNRDNMIQAFMRGMQERSVLLNKDPSVVLDEMLDKVGPGKVLLTNMLHGAGAALLNQPFKTVRESLMDRLVEQQKIQLQKQQNDSLRLQQLLTLNSRERNVDAQQAGATTRTEMTVAEQRARRLQTGEITREGYELREKLAGMTMEQKEEFHKENMALAERGMDVRERLAAVAEESVEIQRYKAEHPPEKRDGFIQPDLASASQSPFSILALESAAGLGLDKNKSNGIMNTININAKKIAQDPENAPLYRQEMRQALEGAINAKTSERQEVLYDLRKSTLSGLDAISNVLDEMAAKGLETGLTVSWKEKIARGLGKTQDPLYVELESLVTEMLTTMINAKSGAAFTPAEEKKYTSLLTSLRNGEALNRTLVKEVQSIFAKYTFESIKNAGIGNASSLFLNDKGQFILDEPNERVYDMAGSRVGGANTGSEVIMVKDPATGKWRPQQ